MITPRPALLLCLALCVGLLGGCVPKGKYLELEDAFNTTNASQKSRINALEAELAALQATLEDERNLSAGRIAELEEELAAMKSRIERLDAQKAGLLADKSKLKASVEEMTAALAELERRRAAAERRVADFKDMLKRFQKLIDSGTLTVRIVDGRMVVQLKTDILFDSGSAALSAPGKAAIAEVAAVLESIPERAYQVEGHTDDVPIKTAQYPSNWELASARALTVVRTMIDGGLAAARVSAASFGEFKPTALNDSKEGKAANRRIEIVVLPDLSDLPGFDQLNDLSD